MTNLNNNKLQRRLSPFHLLLLSINGMVGSAWLFAPLYAAKIAGSWVLISWVIGAVITLMIALTYAELSAAIPVAGGSTRLAQLTQGQGIGFIISWMAWLSSVAIPPVEVLTVLQYLSTYFPSLVHTVNHTVVLTGTGFIYAMILMLFLCILNIASFKGFIRFNFLVITFKLLVIAATIILLMHHRFITSNFFIPTTHTEHLWETMLSAVATGGIAFAFTGFKHGIELAGETTSPHIAIPLALIGSIVACLVIYLGVQVAFIGSLSPQWLTHGWHNISFQHDVGPFMGIAIIFGLGILVKLLLTDAVISPLGAGLIYVTSTARIIFAMSKNGYLPSFLSHVDKNHFPTRAVWLNYCVGMLLFLPLPGWGNLVSFLVSAVAISYSIAPISLLCLRISKPELKRAFRLPFAYITSFIAFYCCSLLNYWTGWETLYKLSIAILIGFLCFIYRHYHIRKYSSNEAPQHMHWKNLYWLAPYLIGLLCISYAGNYGGGHGWIGFGWDFLFIGIFSYVIFYLAIKCRLPDRELNQQLEYLLKHHES